jgi:asparagine synthase (glutamine-hydrolysing)
VCGICGIFKRSGAAVDAEVLVAMRDAMRHRGPDDVGQFLEGSFGVGFRRLSIIDLSTGNQPIRNEDGTVVLVFNGEIYNYKPLREELLNAGHHFTTQTDSEVIVHLYEQYGESFVDRLNGMFAIAIWDRVRKQLVLARDRTGEKPLYYRQTGRDIYFASEMKAFLKVPGLRISLREDVLPAYLSFGNVDGPDTLIKDTYELPPGHIAVVDEEEFKIRQYWDVHYRTDTVRSEGSFTENLKELLEESVSMRLMSDVPLGAFLSGGIDSSLIVALMSRVMDEPVKTFCVGFDIPNYSELEYSRRVALLLKTDHHELSISSDDFLGAVPKLIYFQDEPIVHPAAVPLHFLATFAKQEGVTVLLSGEGGDELFAGYGSYATLLRDVRTRAMLPAFLWRFGSKLAPYKVLRKYRNVCERYGQPLENLILSVHSSLSMQELSELTGSNDYSLGYFMEAVRKESDSPLQRILYAHLKTRLVSLLMKQDKMTMAASLEVRVPFLDHRIVELAATMGDDLKIRGGEGKYILKKLAASFLPADVVKRRKMGFPVPLSLWFREREDALGLLFERRTVDRGLFDREFVQNIIQEHRRGHHDYGYLIWLMINLEHWIRIFIEGEDVSLSSVPIGPMTRRKLPASGLASSSAPVLRGAASF